jgi:hypothetical protein
VALRKKKLRNKPKRGFLECLKRRRAVKLENLKR